MALRLIVSRKVGTLTALVFLLGILVAGAMALPAHAATAPPSPAPTTKVTPSVPSPTPLPAPQPNYNAPADEAQAPAATGADSELDNWLPAPPLRHDGPRTAYEERGDSGYGLPQNLGIRDTGDKMLMPIKGLFMTSIVWVTGLLCRLISIAFFNDLFSSTLGPLAYHLVNIEHTLLYNPLIGFGVVILILAFSWHWLAKNDGTRATKLLLGGAAVLAVSIIVFSAPAQYFGGADKTATDLSGALLGTAGQASEQLTKSNQPLTGDAKTVALRRITSSLHEQLVTKPWCNAVLAQPKAIDEYCARLRSDQTVSATEADQIAQLPKDQQADARKTLEKKKSDDFDKVEKELKGKYPEAYDRIRGHDSVNALAGLIMSALVVFIICVVIGMLAIIVIVSRLAFYFGVAISPGVVPLALFGEWGMRVFRAWLILLVLMQLAIQVVVAFILSMALIFSYGILASPLPWGVQCLAIAGLFLLLLKKRNRILEALTSDGSSRAVVGLRLINHAAKAAGAGVRKAVAVTAGAVTAGAAGAAAGVTASELDEESDPEPIDQRSNGQ